MKKRVKSALHKVNRKLVVSFSCAYIVDYVHGISAEFDEPVVGIVKTIRQRPEARPMVNDIM